MRLRYDFCSRSRVVVLCFVIVNARFRALLVLCEAFSLVFCSLSIQLQARTFIFIDLSSSFTSAESDGRFGVAQSVDEHGERV
jgi:hypothetical protein